MHELSIAKSVVDSVLAEIEQRNLQQVETIVMRVGAMSGVVPEALEFSYETITKDTPLNNTKLEIQEIPVQARCEKCGNEFVVEDLNFSCPKCHFRDIDLIHGDELDIVYLEVRQ